MLILAWGAGLTSCGYHVTGSSEGLPKTIGTIAIPAFGNITTQYKLSDLLATAISREFISRTRYHVVADPQEADATLTGSVVNYITYPTIYDPAQSRAAGADAIVVVSITLRDRAGKVLFTRPNMEIRTRYEISIDPGKYFDESEPAMQRVSQEVARSVVSAVIENF